jgi:ABC-type nitrate/sulfonate/bicarbonate transport system substrate-binding protein
MKTIATRLTGLYGLRIVCAALLGVALLLAGCGSGGAASGSCTPSVGGPSTAPKLCGATIRIAVGAAPAVEDTKVALMAQILNQWGAKASVVNQTGDPAAIRVILAGDADVGSIAVSSAINSGLLIFGPSQPRLDYHFMGAPSLTSIADLPGHVYGTSNTHGLEALMFADLLAKNSIDPSSVKVTLAGGASVRVGAMLTHHIDATFVHYDSVSQLTKAGFNDLAKMSDVAPELADSFMGSSPNWVHNNPVLAEVVNEAWIKAAQIFNNDASQWVSAAVKYAGGSTADAMAVHDGLLQADTFPVAKSAFSAASASTQENLAAQVGAINTKPALSVWFTETYWDQAVAALNIS